MQKSKVIVICGPTASGKTALSVELAKAIDGQVVSADSMQIYDEMLVGTARPTTEEMQGIKHYLVGTVPPNQRFTVSDYKKEAEIAIKQIIQNKKNPIVVGGTGLYINSLIYGIDYPEIETNLEYREGLEDFVKINGLDKLYEKAYSIDPEATKRISKNDKKRILRILEIYKQTSKTKTALELESRKGGIPFDYKVFAINIQRDILYERINKRVDLMISNGLIEEAERLYKKYGNDMCTSMQAIGYKEIIDYFNGIYTKDEMIDKIKMETRRYAKRQLTWFRKNKEIIWINGKNNIEKNVNIILKTYNMVQN